MYQVMIVDDEPMAASLIVNIIKRKYSNFDIMGTAYDGEEALELMEKKGEPDVLITDIQMPVMNGLKLVEETKKRYPEVLSVIVSGYQEFEYAKQAIAFGVCDYILKPIVPSEFAKLIVKIEEKLRQKYYKERNGLMHRMVNELPVDEKALRRYFQLENYYGAIVRLNGLPSRYGERGKKEIFSDINEMMLAYGRDTQETLYLCPGVLVSDEDYEQMIRHRIEKEQPEAAYVTTIIRRKSVPAGQIGEMVRELYRALDASIILGKSQTIIIEDAGNFQTPGSSGRDYEYLEELEYLAEKQKYDRLQKDTEMLIRKWVKEEHTQLWIEGRVRQISYLLQRYSAGNRDYREAEFLMDDIFSGAENVDQLCCGISDIFFKDVREESAPAQKADTEEYFDSVKEYIRKHMAEQLSLHSVSKAVGVSQTYLSRLFRKYEDASFNTYLTALRMEKAKKLLLREDKMYVKDVAEKVGYKDQFYFSRIFYSYTGMRPSEYVEK